MLLLHVYVYMIHTLGDWGDELHKNWLTGFEMIVQANKIVASPLNTDAT